MNVNLIKKSTVLFLLLSIFILSCPGTYGLLYGEGEEVRSRLEIPEPLFDFGTVMQGDVVKHDFTIRNKGNADLLISRVVASCGCTAGNVEPNVIPAGGEGIVKVEFNTSGFSGEKLKTVRIYSNDLDEAVSVVSLKGNIETGVTISPNTLNFGKVFLGSDKMPELDVKVSTREGISISEVKTFSKLLVVNTEKTSDGVVAKVSIAPDVPIGEFRDRILVGLEGASNSSLAVPVFASVKGDLDLEPESVSFGVVEGGDRIERSVRIKAVEKELQLEVLGVKSSNEAVSVESKEVKKGQEFVIHLSLDPSKLSEDLRASIEIKTNSKVQPTVSFNVYGLRP